jgi:hypothetical protein
VLQGRLTGADAASLAGNLVVLFDRAGKRLEGAEAPLDEFARFVIKLTLPAAPGREPASREVFLRVLDRRERAIFRHATPFTAASGEVEYVEISLSQAAPTAPDPGEAPPAEPPEQPGREEPPGPAPGETDVAPRPRRPLRPPP